MPLPTKAKFDPQEWIDKKKQEAQQETKPGHAHALLIGESGAGKSYTIGTTAPTPMLVYSFDPGGWRAMRPLIEKGDIVLVDDFELTGETADDPKLWPSFVDMIKEHSGGGLYDNFKTVVFDSLTSIQQCAQAHLFKGAKGDFDTWRMFKQSMEGFAHNISAIPCHVFVTAHVETTKDDVNGAIEKTLYLNGQAQKTLPIIFSDVWALIAREGPNGVKRQILTDMAKSYITRTRTEYGKTVPTYAEPDITKLLTQLGLET